MLSDIFSFSFTLFLPNWLLISIRIYSGIARFPCDSMAFLYSLTISYGRLSGEDASKTLIQAFASCRLYHCNSPFLNISEGLMNWLQSVENACRKSGYWYSTFRPYNTGASSATLANSTPASTAHFCYRT